MLDSWVWLGATEGGLVAVFWAGGTGWAGHGLAVLLNITEVRADAGDKPIHTVDQFVLDFRPVVLRGFKTSVELVLNS